MRVASLLLGVSLLCVGGAALHAQESSQGSSGTDLPENTRMAHAVTFLSSLAADAESIARAAEDDASDIRSRAIALVRGAKDVRNQADEEQFLRRVRGACEGLFADGDRSFPSFRTQAAATLQEISEALPLLAVEKEGGLPIGPSPSERIAQRMDAIATELQYVEDSVDLFLWLHAFRGVADDLRALVPVPDLATARNDLAALLDRLRTYIATVEASGITVRIDSGDITAIDDRIRELRSPEQIPPLVRDLEMLFSSITEGTASEATMP